MLDWDEDPTAIVTGFAVTVDGVRTDYGLTPRQRDGTCNCSVPLPFSSGRHTVSVIAYNASGESSSAPLIVGPTSNPGGPYSGVAGTTVSVTGAGSTDTVGTITTYTWSWGDGTANSSGTSATASHTYASAGAFTITLSVADDFGANHSATTTATIAAAAQQLPGMPASPNPANAATGISMSPTLTWTDSGATSYDVQLGKTNPPPQVAAGMTSPAYVPGALTAGSTYFWRIVARNSGGSTTGPVWSFTTAASQASATDIVIYASDILASNVHGSWTTAADSTSPNGVKLVSPNAGRSAISTPLVTPTDYIDVPFDATPGTPYTLWIRLRAQGNSKWNDSLWVQFSDAQVGGVHVYPLDSTSALLVNLATSNSGKSISGWGWQNGAYWLTQAATITFAGASTHTLRIQVREDGIQFDQIVLSPSTYLTTPPGPVANDATIVKK